MERRNSSSWVPIEQSGEAKLTLRASKHLQKGKSRIVAVPDLWFENIRQFSSTEQIAGEAEVKDKQDQHGATSLEQQNW